MSGCIILGWKKEMDITIMRYSSHCVYFHVLVEGTVIWRGAGIYGWPEKTKKFHTWELVRMLKSLDSKALMCFGDFNEIPWSSEKKGGLHRDDKNMVDFQDLMEECNIMDLDFVGDEYTWFNRRSGIDSIWERLDRVIVDTQWFNLFPGAQVTTLPRIDSDHNPIIIEMIPPSGQVRQRRRFRFKPMWIQLGTYVEDMMFKGRFQRWGTHSGNGIEMFLDTL
ncbi:hypothetical protein M5689_006549 [Euphorbia peplus]|nr:hypothetical protein M5689_006549 [Euphorbia peplus]